MDGRGSQCASRSRTGRWLIATCSRVLSIHASAAGVYRRMGTLPQEHCPCVWRQSQKDGGSGKRFFKDLAGPCIRNGDQATEEKRGGGITSRVTLGDHGEAQK